jgi:hypothetical protein
MRFVLLGLFALLGCGDPQSTVLESTADQPAASARIFWVGVEVTQHIPLNAGESIRMEVRLYTPSGARIIGNDDKFTLTHVFTPAGMATGTPVAGSPLQVDFAATGAPDTHGTLSITVRHATSGTTRTFGPFEVLLH